MIEVIPVPLLRDNYAYFIADRASGKAVIVDPSEAEPVLEALAKEQLTPVAIWCTHHHWDHVGGVPGLVRVHPELPVVGSAYDFEHKRIEHQTRGLTDGDTLEHGGVTFEVISIPGHTLGAIAFVGGGAALTGDTLFTGGCGRVFEGTMAMMRSSLSRLRELPPDTRVWCGHEYTTRNLEFAAAVEPQEMAIRARLDAMRALRDEERPTVPGTIAEERTTNPFLRWDAPAVRSYAQSRGPAANDDEIFARIREAKDAF